MKLETIIYDWSGVISDDILPVYNTCMQIFDLYHLDRISLEEYKNRSKNPHSEFWKEHIKNLDMSIIQFLFNNIIAKGPKPKILPGVKDTLAYLKKKKIDMFVLSSHPEHLLLEEAKRYGIASYFKRLYGSKYYKDRMLGQMLADYKLNPERTLFVEDMAEGIDAAKLNNIRSAALLSGYHDKAKLESANPDYIFQDITGLKQLFD